MKRVTIGFLSVQETSLSAAAVLPPGTVLVECKVVRLCAGQDADPYLVHFKSGGQAFSCPLYTFQPRTRTVCGEMEEALPSPAALAV